MLQVCQLAHGREEDHDVATMSQALSQALADAELTPGALAERVGVSRRTVYRWLHGDTLPTRHQLPLIAQATNRPLDSFPGPRMFPRRTR